MLFFFYKNNMAEKATCGICNIKFKDASGLAQHNAAKHPSNSSSPAQSNTVSDSSFNFKKLKTWIIALIILGFIFWIVSASFGKDKACKTDPVTEINIGSHQNLDLHIHADLEIIIDGISREISSNIGIGPGIMRPIHTHDNSGEIHMEGPCIRDFKLGEFFLVWGKRLDSSCILDSCIQNGAIEMMVNGKENKEFDNYIMEDQDKISIKFTSDKI
mgnify:CR=1 FL=1